MQALRRSLAIWKRFATYGVERDARGLERSSRRPADLRSGSGSGRSDLQRPLARFSNPSRSLVKPAFYMYKNSIEPDPFGPLSCF